MRKKLQVVKAWEGSKEKGQKTSKSALYGTEVGTRGFSSLIILPVIRICPAFSPGRKPRTRLREKGGPQGQSSLFYKAVVLFPRAMICSFISRQLRMHMCSRMLRCKGRVGNMAEEVWCRR